MQRRTRTSRPALLLAAAWLLLVIPGTCPVLAQHPAAKTDVPGSASQQVSRPIRPPGEEAVDSSEPAPMGGSTRQAVIRVAASMTIVLSIFFLVIWFLRRSLPRQARSLPKQAFEILGTATLSSRHTLQLIKIGNRLLLISLAAGGASSLAEISDEVEVERLLSLCQAGGRGKEDEKEAVYRKDSFQQVLSEMGIDRSGTTGTRQAS